MPKKKTETTHKKKRMGRPPIDDVRELVPLRLNSEECEAFRLAAEKLSRKEGKDIGYTTWMRLVCRREAGLDP